MLQVEIGVTKELEYRSKKGGGKVWHGCAEPSKKMVMV